MHVPQNFGIWLLLVDHPNFLSYVIEDRKPRDLAVTNDRASINSNGKPMNEASNDVNKVNAASKVEHKQSSSDIRPKEGWPLKPSICFIQIY